MFPDEVQVRGRVVAVGVVTLKLFTGPGETPNDHYKYTTKGMLYYDLSGWLAKERKEREKLHT